MDHPSPHDPHLDGEDALDPRLERVAKKMRRLSIISSLIMFTGVFVVLGVILYRSLTATPEQAYPDNLTAEEIRRAVFAEVGPASIGSVTLDGTSVFVAVEGETGAALVEVDRATWQVVSTLRFVR
ncbi:MAG: hypothetical protein AAF590_05640 [Pseudomonadota bacterium]